MEKYIDPSSYEFDEPVAQLVETFRGQLSSDWLRKRAAADVFSGMDIRAEPGHSIIHLIAMGDADRFGKNKNRDFYYKSARDLNIPHGDWTKVELRKPDEHGNPRYHTKNASTYRDHVDRGVKDQIQTFVDHGAVYEEHHNRPKEGDKVYGSIKAAAHNDEMWRPELLIQVPHGPDWDSDLQKLASGKDIGFSMSCDVTHDVCSVCGHVSTRAADYCPHISKLAYSLCDDGLDIGMVNETPDFFDISRVKKPADRIAWSLRKAASVIELAADLPEARVSAPQLPVLSKRAGARRKIVFDLGRMEKRIPLQASMYKAKASAAPSLHVDLKQVFSDKKAAEFLGQLVKAGCCLSFSDWARTFVQASEERIAKCAAHLPTLFSDLEQQAFYLAGDSTYASLPPVDDPRVVSLHPSISLSKQAAESRVWRAAGEPREIQTSSAAVSAATDPLLKGYATYKLACVEAALAEDSSSPAVELAILQNCVLS